MYLTHHRAFRELVILSYVDAMHCELLSVGGLR
jgi:hypothetical protein